MPRSRLGTARDYNRALVAPIRGAHLAAAAVADAVGLVRGFVWRPDRRAWAVPALFIGLGLLVMPLDGAINSMLRGTRLGGDVRRELEAWQQFGGVGSLVFAAVLIWLLDPARRRRLADLALAAAGTGLVCWVVKMSCGRARPKFGDPELWTGPIGGHPIEGSVVRAAEFWRDGASDLWAMPSSHTAAAAALAAFLAVVYPRLRLVGIVMIGLVAFARLALSDKGSHWASDVIIGGTLGYTIAFWVATLGLGQRLLDRARGSAAPRASGDPSEVPGHG